MLNKQATLTPEVNRIVSDKGTEAPFSSSYHQQKKGSGTFLCRRCGLALFRGDDQFISACGWPSFDDAVADHVKEQLDADGQRIEIVCCRCDGHLGHVFRGEQLTNKNQRYCLNGLSLDFVSNQQVTDSEEAIYAGGCFWGMEYYFEQCPGVLKTEAGYSGGHIDHPSYEQICSGNGGHLEVLRVVYDPKHIDYEQLSRLFFEIHDPTQRDGQGPDIGQQYLSAVFYFNRQQQQIIDRLINELLANGYQVATKLLSATIFWPAEDYHQHYYQYKQQQPYCHRRVQRFDIK